MSAAEQAVEQVADVVEEIGDEAELAALHIRRITGRDMGMVLYGSIIGTAGGLVVGYFFAKSRLETKYEKLLQDELDEMRDHFRARETARQEQTEKPDLQERVEALGYATKSAPDIETPEVEVPEPQVTNVFVENERGLSTEVWDYDRELASRTADRPYVIHKQEFMDSPDEYDQMTLTYFVQDDVLANQADQRMDDIDERVALENLEKFGHGSEDANVVYVRNDRLKLDFEILRSGGSYTAEVLNVEDPADELQHSATRHRRPQRGFDDD